MKPNCHCAYCEAFRVRLFIRGLWDIADHALGALLLIAFTTGAYYVCALLAQAIR